MDFNLDVDTLKSLIKLMADNGLHELELEEEGKRIHLRRGEERGHATHAPVIAHAPAPAFSMPHVAPSAPAASPAAGGKGGEPLPPGVKVIKSPMVGTFYRSPSPDASSFVEAGDKVQEDTVLCIIEAMKVMNEIRAEVKGEIVKCLAANGEAVEYGEPLFHVKIA
ncbi:MAG: acetyl-CoA carboxylase biotin carboxyl carrier protein [Planctomycetota bacterium]